MTIRARGICVESFIIVFITTIDLVLTLIWIDKGMAQEGNPVMNYYLQHGLWAFVAAKMVLVIVPIFIFEYARRINPKFVKKVARLTIAAYLGIYGLLFLKVNIPTMFENETDGGVPAPCSQTMNIGMPGSYSAPKALPVNQTAQSTTRD